MELEEWIKRYGMDNCVSADEVLTYLKAPTYENDLFDISSILNNEYLVLHELLEVCCLKRKGIEINDRTILDTREDVYFCQLEAMEGEMEYALRMGDEAWVENRVRDLRSYLADPYLPEGLRKRVLELIKRFGD